MNFARYLIGWVRVRIAGAEPEKFLSALGERGIVFWGAGAPRDFEMEVSVPLRAAKLVAPLAAALGCEGEILSRHGLPTALGKLRHRMVLLICSVTALVLLFFGGAFLWNIEIEGCETVSESRVRQALSECGVDIGSCWLGLDQDRVRNDMILRIPEIRWMTVTVRGSHARVILRERRTGPEPVAEEEPGHLVARKAGLVTQVEAYRGTAITVEQDAVLPGELLVGGYTTGRYGVQGPVRAIGEVWARTWYERTAVAPVELTVTVPTGEQAVKWSLILGKMRINFYKGSSICPVDCDKIIYVYPLAKAGVFTLPVAVEKTVYESYVPEAQRAEELRAELESQLMEELREEIGQEGSVLSATFTASEAEGLLLVTLRAECHESIGIYRALTEQELWDIQAKIPKTEEDT